MTRIILFYLIPWVLVGVALSTIGALIIWGCAKGIAQIKRATFLSSWGLCGILISVQLACLAVWGLWPSNVDTLFFILFWAVYSTMSALYITKIYWKCTFRQSFMTHMNQIILLILILVFLFVERV
tara:strand:+ start:85 stop:462 length:378 start_codon:yes stop_codon:yes gene_type:complete